jgi:hypothetical protein
MNLRNRLASLERAAGPAADGPPPESIFDKARRLQGWLRRYLHGEVPLAALPTDVREWVERLEAEGEIDRLREAGPGEEPPCA